MGADLRFHHYRAGKAHIILLNHNFAVPSLDKQTLRRPGLRRADLKQTISTFFNEDLQPVGHNPVKFQPVLSAIQRQMRIMVAHFWNQGCDILRRHARRIGNRKIKSFA